uniref:gamma-glutamyltransferase n=1 Tax=Rhodothermus marinus TaxID=29549 RepID=UPI0034E2554E
MAPDFFLNNEMDDFSAAPGVPNMFGLVGSEANAIAPGKRMLSSMTPTIVEDPEGRLFLVLGTPGGSTIITTVFQLVLNVIDHGMNIQQAVLAPRIHHQWLPDVLYYERRGLPRDVVDNLKRRGWKVVERDDTSGRAHAIQVVYGPDELAPVPGVTR